MRCVVTGATGYIGGRLVPSLLDAGHEVVCVTRDPRSLRDVPWHDRVEVAAADVSRPDTLSAPMAGADVAYYLVHSLAQSGFAAKDRAGAANFAAAARDGGVRRIVYLGGPEPATGIRASEHLSSRSEVARILLDSGVPTIALRAAVIIGSGSASFEMLRYLTERLPVMVTPRWVRNPVQPIAIRDVLRYLVACADFDALPPSLNRSFDIGGPDVLTYAEMMQGYARVAGLNRRVIVPVRPLTPWLSSHWVGLVTPVPNAIARPLVSSLIHPAVAHEHDIASYVPDPSSDLIGFEESVRLSLAKIRDLDVETRWSTATWSYGGIPPYEAEPLPSDPEWSGGSVYTDIRAHAVDASVDQLWRVIEGVGGENGWYSFPLAWSMRGWLDRAIGGVGLRRGRRDPHRVYVGEALDFWRVEEVTRPSASSASGSVTAGLLRLRAEMRLPGQAWLEMKASPSHSGGALYEQRAVFLPKGLAGHAYWACVWPFHAFVFGGMAHNIAVAASRLSSGDRHERRGVGWHDRRGLWKA
jgi:uncharacterized protein YbjT (DUF2867 family)